LIHFYKSITDAKIEKMTSRKMRKSPGAGFGQYPDSVFSQQGMEELHPQLVKQARKSGQLNLSNRGLTMVPDKVWNISEFDKEEQKTLSNVTMDSASNENWWDQVDMTKLILACNKISVISPKISNLCSLAVLDLHDNQLEDLPDELGDLRSMTRLNLSHNRFSRIPNGIFQMIDLRVLQLNNNKIELVDERLGDVNMLHQLDLANNHLQGLPGSIGFLTKVSNLNLSNNKLEDLPPEISSMSGLTTLDLNNNKLKSIPESMKNLSHLEILYLRNNNISSLPALTHCTNLKELHLGSNCIKEISKEDIENILNVRTLDLRENKIDKISDDVTLLQLLERLDLSNNDLSTIPYTLGVLPHLKTLQIEGNPMKTIRRDIVSRGTVGLLKYLRSRLEEDQIVELQKGGGNVSPVLMSGSPPIPDKYTLKTSQSLNLSSKSLVELPNEAVENASEAKVQAVDISKNQFSAVPENLEQILPLLYELNISNNKIIQIPNFIGTGRLLQFLDLGNNRLSSLPDEISSLTHLREIILNVNQFETVPECVFGCQKLETLLIANNKISIIDVDGLSKLKQLAILDLQNNAVQSVPPQLGNLTQIRTLQLEGNLFRMPRAAILVQGTGAVMAYLRDRIPK